MALTTEEILEELDCLYPSPLENWRFMYYLLYLTANNGAGNLPPVTPPIIQPEPETFVVPSVFARFTSPDVGAIIRYTEDPILIPNIVYSNPIRTNLADAPSRTVSYRVQANSADGLRLSEIAEKTLTSTTPWQNVWNLDLNGNDSVGAVNLVPKGAVVFNTAPNLHTANLDGVASLMTTDITTMQSPIFTVSCWAKLTSVSVFSFLWAFERLNSNEGLCLFVHADLTIEAQLLQTSGYVTYRSPSPLILLNIWQHHVLVGDGTNVIYYRDGVEEFSFPYDGTLDPVYIQRFSVGSEIIGVDTPRYGVIGNMDRVYYMPTALSPADVEQLYTEDLLYTKL